MSLAEQYPSCVVERIPGGAIVGEDERIHIDLDFMGRAFTPGEARLIAFALTKVAGTLEDSNLPHHSVKPAHEGN